MSTTWGQLSDRLVDLAIDKRIPLIGQFELTSRCNLQCKMCYLSNPADDRESMSRERSAKEWISLIERARDSGMLYLLFTGGEVFLHKDFKEIYEAASLMGLNIVFYTNATMITPEIAEWLGCIPPSRVEVTLYGASAETYDRVCGNPHGYSQAIRGINLLLSQNISLKIRTTVVKANAKDFYEIAKIAEARGVELGIVDYVSPRRDGCRTHPQGERLSPEELAAYLRDVDIYFGEEDIRFECIKPNTMAEKSGEVITHASEEGPFFCEAGRCAFWVTWDGRMTPCGLMNEPVVYPFENDFGHCWLELGKRCMEIPVCVECSSCSFKKECICCPGRLKNETGFYNKPADYLCELARSKA